jgi:methionine sulfoxide reductase heme-binding subunit
MQLVSNVRTALRHRWAKPVLWGLCLWPLSVLVWRATQDALGANPAETLIRSTGDWTLRWLCLTLSVTPLRVSLGWTELARFRRALGVSTYGYVCLHLLCYAGFDMGFDVDDIWRDIMKRPFILVGFSGFVLLTPLAVTSINAVIRKLGAARWQRLHRTIYVIAALAVLHFYWMRAGKHNFADVWLYGSWLFLLMLWRVGRYVQTRLAQQ